MFSHLHSKKKQNSSFFTKCRLLCEIGPFGRPAGHSLASLSWLTTARHTGCRLTTASGVQLQAYNSLAYNGPAHDSLAHDSQAYNGQAHDGQAHDSLEAWLTTAWLTAARLTAARLTAARLTTSWLITVWTPPRPEPKVALPPTSFLTSHTKFSELH